MINLRFGHIQEYLGERGFGFLKDAMDSRNIERGPYFHIKTIKRKYADLAQRIDSGAWHDVMFWYCTGVSSRGRGEEVTDLWLTSEELPSNVRGNADKIVSRYLNNFDHNPSHGLEVFTRTAFGEAGLAELRAERQRRYLLIKEEQEVRERLLAEQNRKREEVKRRSKAFCIQQEHARNEKRWTAFLNRRFDSYAYYSETHNALIERAKTNRPVRVGDTVTDFTDWIYSLYIPKKNERSLQLGRRCEKDVQVEKMNLESNKSLEKDLISIPADSEWKLVYNGMSTSDSAALRISALMVNQQPIFGKPDLVFQEYSSGRILIVEIKISEAPIPDGGWPNLRAQLWAYSKIDMWSKARDILLVGEIWGYKEGFRLRRAMRWQPIDLEDENMQLYELYKLQEKG